MSKNPELSPVSSPSVEDRQYSPETVASIEAGEYDAIAAGNMLQHYLNEIAKRPLLKREEEFELGRQIQAGLHAANVLDGLSPEGMSEEEREGLMATVQDGLSSKRTLLESNLRLVVSMSKRGTLQHMELLDVIQYGNIGLMAAAEKFDPDKGFKFSTYATKWIDKHIRLGKAEENYSVRLPEKIAMYFHTIHFAIQELEAQLRREPTDQELEQYVSINDERVNKSALIKAYRVHYREHYSLDDNSENSGDDEGGGSIADSLIDENQDVERDALQHDTYSTILSRAVRRLVDDAIQEYSDKDKAILYMQLGFDGLPLTPGEIGKKMKCDNKRPGRLEGGLIQWFREDPALFSQLLKLMAEEDPLQLHTENLTPSKLLDYLGYE